MLKFSTAEKGQKQKRLFEFRLSITVQSTDNALSVLQFCRAEHLEVAPS